MDNVCKAIHFNRVWLSGQVAAEPELSHSNHDQVFFRFFLSVQRLSGQCDVLPVMISRHQLQLTPLHRGQHICLTGQLRSFNNKSGDGPRLILSVLARQVEGVREGTVIAALITGYIVNFLNRRVITRAMLRRVLPRRAEAAR